MNKLTGIFSTFHSNSLETVSEGKYIHIHTLFTARVIPTKMRGTVMKLLEILY